MKSQIQELEEIIKKDGKVLIYMVHENLYGPIRGLHFVLRNPNPKTLNDYLKKENEITARVWEKTMLATKPMIIPISEIPNLETKPLEFNCLEDGEDFIIKKVNSKLYEDPWYYRLGTI
jgi:hypothetical protein